MVASIDVAVAATPWHWISLDEDGPYHLFNIFSLLRQNLSTLVRDPQALEQNLSQLRKASNFFPHASHCFVPPNRLLRPLFLSMKNCITRLIACQWPIIPAGARSPRGCNATPRTA